MNLQEYLQKNLDALVCDHSIRAENRDGLIRFYIHPHSVDGDTLDFIVSGNELRGRCMDCDDLKSRIMNPSNYANKGFPSVPQELIDSVVAATDFTKPEQITHKGEEATTPAESSNPTAGARGGDETETTDQNPKSYVAWKTYAEKLEAALRAIQNITDGPDFFKGSLYDDAQKRFDALHTEFLCLVEQCEAGCCDKEAMRRARAALNRT